MRRRRYQSPEDSERARKIMSIFAKKFGYRATEVANEFSPVDFNLIHESLPKVEAFAEVKTRNGKVNVDGKIISLVKYVEIKTYCQHTDLPCYIVYGYPDDNYRIIYVQVGPLSPTPKIVWGGRKDREDRGDMEALAQFSKGQEQELNWREQ